MGGLRVPALALLLLVSGCANKVEEGPGLCPALIVSHGREYVGNGLSDRPPPIGDELELATRPECEGNEAEKVLIAELDGVDPTIAVIVMEERDTAVYVAESKARQVSELPPALRRLLTGRE